MYHLSIVRLVFRFAMSKYMVDHSNLLIAVYNGEAGGTRNALNYAKKKDIEIIVIEN